MFSLLFSTLFQGTVRLRRASHMAAQCNLNGPYDTQHNISFKDAMGGERHE